MLSDRRNGEKKILWWLVTFMTTIILATTGTLYVSLSNEVGKKADKEIVSLMQKDISDIKTGIEDLKKMHMRNDKRR